MIQEAIEEIVIEVSVLPVSLHTVHKAWEIKRCYQFSYWDSLIVAAALEGKCSTLFSEDLQHGQILENRLVVKNPFWEE